MELFILVKEGGTAKGGGAGRAREHNQRWRSTIRDMVRD